MNALDDNISDAVRAAAIRICEARGINPNEPYFTTVDNRTISVPHWRNFAVFANDVLAAKG